MFEGFERMRHWLQFSEPLLQQIHAIWTGGPKVEVCDQNNTVKVVIEAPELLHAQNKHQWAVRVIDQNLYLRGQLQQEETAHNDCGRYYSERRNEQFTKVIPLPAPVVRKPVSVKYEDGLVTILLEKQKGPSEDEWQPLDFYKKK
jgi:HSP20 family molecular chaperone IbpA